MHFLLFLLSPLLLFGEELKESFLSELQRESFRLKKESVENSTDKLQNSWINPINGSYGIDFNNQNEDNLQQSQSFTVSIDQPIFKSGGIFYAVKYAKNLRKAESLGVEKAKKETIKSILNILFSIKEVEFQIEKQKLVVSNSEIDLSRKSEQYREGLLDSSFVDNALIAKNSNQLITIDLRNQKRGLILQLQELSDIDHRSFILPTLDLLTEKQFLERDISLKRTDFDIESKKYYEKMQFSRYLPTVSLNGSYNYVDVDNPSFGGGNMLMEDYSLDYYQFGVRVSIPIVDLNRGYDNEKAKIDYLQSRVDKRDLNRKLKLRYQLTIDKVQNIEQKTLLAEENLQLYKNLLKDTESLFGAGLRTELDVKNLKNSIGIKKFEIKILKLNRQKLLLELL
jgi:outer membrane protein TolC